MSSSSRIAEAVTVLVPRLRLPAWVTPATTLVPSQYTTIVFPTGMATPVPLGVFTVIICAVLLSTMYILDAAGQTTVPAPDKAVPESVSSKIAQRDSAVVPSAEVSVWELVVHELITALPATACSTIEVILLLTTSPQVPTNSPCTGSASLRIVVYCVAIFLTSCGYGLPIGSLHRGYGTPIWTLRR